MKRIISKLEAGSAIFLRKELNREEKEVFNKLLNIDLLKIKEYPVYIGYPFGKKNGIMFGNIRHKNFKKLIYINDLLCKIKNSKGISPLHSEREERFKVANETFRKLVCELVEDGDERIKILYSKGKQLEFAKKMLGEKEVI